MARALFVSAAAVLLLAFGTADAHICLTYPMMRGPQPDLYPGDEVCYQRTGNCGNLVKGPTTATFIAGTPTTLTFQQNLNHFWKPNPGYFDLSVSYDNEATWTQLGKNISDFPANNMNTQTWFNVPVVFDTVTDSAVVRARYVSHNADEVVPDNNTEAIFYSCSDVQVIKPGKWGPGALSRTAATHAMKPVTQPKHLQPKTTMSSSGSNSCKTPSKFYAVGIESDFQHQPVLVHNISYDTDIGMIKWVRSNKDIGGSYSMTDYWNLTMLPAGYTPQYIYGLNGAGTCDLYGGDRFSAWQYGPEVAMEFMGNNTDEPTHDTMLFKTVSAGFTYTARVNKNAAGVPSNTCLPSAMQWGANMIQFEAKEVTSFSPGTFTPPAVCTQHMLPTAGCWAHRIKNQEKLH